MPPMRPKPMPWGEIIMLTANMSLECPALITVKLIDSKWKLLILWELSHGDCRFGDILKNIGGIRQKVLTQSLRSLEADGLVSRQVYAEVPPRVEYSVTDLARDLAKVLDVMGEWGIKYAEMKAGHAIEWHFSGKSDRNAVRDDRRLRRELGSGHNELTS